MPDLSLAIKAQFRARDRRTVGRGAGAGDSVLRLHASTSRACGARTNVGKARNRGALGEIAYIMGRETLVATRHGHMGRLTEPMFAFLARNARSTTDHFSIPVGQVVEVGIQLDL